MIHTIPPRRSPPKGEKYRACVLCDQRRTESEFHYNSGSTEPTVGETLTGATSSETGVFVSLTRTSGSWAGGNAAGSIIISSAGDIVADENINGSTGGSNMLTAITNKRDITTGQLWPMSHIVEYEGKYYCREHFKWRYRKKFLDEYIPDIDEGDREGS